MLTAFICPQVKELIRAVKPEVVMVELCKDRVGLLVDERVETQVTNLWHTRKVLGDFLTQAPTGQQPAQSLSACARRSPKRTRSAGVHRRRASGLGMADS